MIVYMKWGGQDEKKKKPTTGKGRRVGEESLVEKQQSKSKGYRREERKKGMKMKLGGNSILNPRSGVKYKK